MNDFARLKRCGPMVCRYGVSPRLSSPLTSWLLTSTLYAAPCESSSANALSTSWNDSGSASSVRSPRCAMNTMLLSGVPLLSMM